MIAPTNKLIFWVAALVLPGVLAATAVPAAMPIVAVLLGLFGLAILIDAVRSLNGLAGLSVSFPAVIRLAKERGGVCPMEVRNERETVRRLRIGLDAPPDLGLEESDQQVMIPAGQPLSQIDWNCLPRRRGRYALNRVFLEAESPFGWWHRRGRLPVQTEVRVYPNLIKERRGMSALFLHRGPLGAHAQRQMGKGRDFERLREYIPGDGMDEISWKATARRGQPITRLFQVERTQEVYVIVDASRLTAREQVPGASHSEAVTSLERHVTAALMLGMAAEQQGDLYGLLTFSNQVDTFLRARRGPAHFNTCRDELYTLQPQPVSPDFEELAAFIRTRLRRRALLIFLTSLDDPVLSENFVQAMDLLCRQHLILVNMLPPRGVEPVFSRDDVTAPDDLYERLGGHLRWRQLRELESTLRKRGVRFALLENERLCPELVSQYLTVKRRQLI